VTAQIDALRLDSLERFLSGHGWTKDEAPNPRFLVFRAPKRDDDDQEVVLLLPNAAAWGAKDRPGYVGRAVELIAAVHGLPVADVMLRVSPERSGCTRLKGVGASLASVAVIVGLAIMFNRGKNAPTPPAGTTGGPSPRPETPAGKETAAPPKGAPEKPAEPTEESFWSSVPVGTTLEFETITETPDRTMKSWLRETLLERTEDEAVIETERSEDGIPAAKETNRWPLKRRDPNVFPAAAKGNPEIVGNETITVPAGTFDCVRARYRYENSLAETWTAKELPFPVQATFGIEGKVRATRTLTKFVKKGS
jgi:hypothetical protein